MRSPFLAIFFVAFLAPIHLLADDSDSGRTLLSECREAVTVLDTQRFGSATSAFSAGVCMGYVAGFDDLSAVYSYFEDDPRTFCVPTEVSREQLIRVLVKYLQDNPARLHENRAILLNDAISDAFPCEQE